MYVRSDYNYSLTTLTNTLFDFFSVFFPRLAHTVYLKQMKRNTECREKKCSSMKKRESYKQKMTDRCVRRVFSSPASLLASEHYINKAKKHEHNIIQCIFGHLVFFLEWRRGPRLDDIYLHVFFSCVAINKIPFHRQRCVAYLISKDFFLVLAMVMHSEQKKVSNNISNLFARAQ